MIFWIKFAQKGEFRSEITKSEYHHWILHIWIRLGPKFQLKLTILTFWTKFVQKEYFQSKTNKMNTTIELCIFELIYNHFQNFETIWRLTKFSFHYNWNDAQLLLINMVYTGFLTGTDQDNGILMSLLLLVAETIMPP